jgi:hypothetical protein
MASPYSITINVGYDNAFNPAASHVAVTINTPYDQTYAGFGPVNDSLANFFGAWAPVAAVFCGRIHYGLIFLDTKRLPQMGDWAMWLNSLFGLVSAGIFAAWMLSLASIGLAGWFGRAISNFRKD